MTKITEELALTSMCVWGELISITATKDTNNAYVRYQQEVGACEMRSLALNTIAPAIESAYKAISEEYHKPFDWEFIPSFLEHAETILVEGLWIISTENAIKIGHTVLAELLTTYSRGITGDTDE
jgi:hypothetical protein